ncbi:MAG: hypothetical protein ACOC3A_11620 [Thermodesulfobacteriota bacterium]
MRKPMVFLFVGLICLAVQGCTARAWFGGLQENAHQDCYRYATPAEIQDCLDSVNSITFDRYTEERKEMIKQPG